MTKQRKTLKVRIPPYQPPRNKWRRSIILQIEKAAASRAITYRSMDQLELIVTLYMTTDEIAWHDVDNRLKDIMDALQGRAGGSKANKILTAVVPNDHQIHKVTIEKRTAPRQSHGWGHLIILKYQESANKRLHRIADKPGSR
ncbi:MAG: RusA family crossover junction endodeoxyribonuclease [Deltaproteobacteria bacterium]|nr:RusA family crossover junction endodeoxyribonuclease [Deltaproteobacteria bacterium]